MLYVFLLAIVVIAVGTTITRRSMSLIQAVWPSAAIGFLLGVALLFLFAALGWRDRQAKWLVAAGAVLGSGLACATSLALLSSVAYFAAHRLSRG